MNMLYHSPIKHFVKGLLGRKNDAWYFDRMVRSYSKKNGKYVGEFIQSLMMSEIKGIPNPMYPISFSIRNELLLKNEQIHSEQSKVFLFHMPPAAFSPAFHSWYQNFGMALEHMGNTVVYEWDLTNQSIQRADVFLTCFNEEYISKINWKDIHPETIVICYFNPFLKDNVDAERHIQVFKKFKIDAAFTFCTSEFAERSIAGQMLKEISVPVISIPFGVNPIAHIPSPVVKPVYDFAFLGSANWDKTNRYADYFDSIVSKYSGIVYGQGWPWTTKNDLSFDRDRRIYASSKIALNLHIDLQIEAANELNERSYILSGIGMAQLSDEPPLIKEVFGDMIVTAKSPIEYLQKFEWMINRPKETEEMTIRLLRFTLINHNCFKRAEILVDMINQLSNN